MAYILSDDHWRSNPLELKDLVEEVRKYIAECLEDHWIIGSVNELLDLERDVRTELQANELIAWVNHTIGAGSNALVLAKEGNNHGTQS